MNAALPLTPPPQADATIELRFQSEWGLIDDAREFLQRGMRRAIVDPHLCEKLGIAAHELMENAFRYSPAAEVKIRVEVEAYDTVRIIVENTASPERIASLLEEVAQLGATEDALAYYQQKMQASVHRTAEGSGLGLARVRFEASMWVDVEIVGDLVRVIATPDLLAG